MVSRRFASDIDLLGYSLLSAMLNPVSSDPGGLGAGQAGRVWFNTATNKLMYWDGTTAIDVRARANHSGSQLASTISDLASTVKAYRLDEFAAPNIDLSLASHKLTNVTDGTGAQDAATKGQLDTAIAGIASGLVLKGAVKVAATTNLSLSAPGATVDGVTMVSGDIMLLTGQSAPAANGPYVWNGAASTATRALNFDTSGEAVLGSFWLVEQGSNANNIAILTNTSAITLGTTALTFSFNTSGASSLTGSSSILVSAGVISAIVGTGLLGGTGAALTPDFSIVGRKAGGVIPTSTSGIFAVSGAVVTINHGLANFAPHFAIRAYTSPAAGYTQGQLVEMDNVATDANNISLTLPGAPASNNWIVAVVG